MLKLLHPLPYLLRCIYEDRDEALLKCIYDVLESDLLEERRDGSADSVNERQDSVERVCNRTADALDTAPEPDDRDFDPAWNTLDTLPEKLRDLLDAIPDISRQPFERRPRPRRKLLETPSNAFRCVTQELGDLASMLVHPFDPLDCRQDDAVLRYRPEEELRDFIYEKPAAEIDSVQRSLASSHGGAVLDFPPPVAAASPAGEEVDDLAMPIGSSQAKCQLPIRCNQSVVGSAFHEELHNGQVSSRRCVLQWRAIDVLFVLLSRTHRPQDVC